MTATGDFDVLIVGAGQGGAQAAIALRQQGYEGSIGLLGEEVELPYERPALSKTYLAGDKPFERILLRPTGFWKDRGVELLLGRCIVAVDPIGRKATTADGGSLGYGTLVWATGGAARRLHCAGGSLPGVHYIRAKSDVDRLIADLPRVRRVAVIGGGYIGLEGAAVLMKLGKSVTLIEAQPRLLSRMSGEALSVFLQAEHAARGVDVRLGASVDHLEERNGRVVAVRLSNGAVLPVDMVIVGIGIAPAVAPLLEAGAAGADGVDVDEGGRTSLPGIFALGDCAAHPNRYANETRVRLESIQNANDMASVVAKSVMGHAARYDAVPWFWSDQYDLKLQTVGLSGGHDAAIVRGTPTSRSFSVVYTRRGRVIALDCVNAVRDFVQGRALVSAGAACPQAWLADTSRPLTEMLPGGNSLAASP